MNLSGRNDVWHDPMAPRGRWRFGAAVAVHAALVAAVVGIAATPEVRTATQDLVVRLIRNEPAAAQPSPPQRPTQPQPVRASTPLPVMTAAAEAPSQPAFAVEAQAPRTPPAEAAPAAVPVSAARFDADYLHNPKPAYPIVSRRNGEEGKVQLRVRVATDGSAMEVEVKQSSGFPRLDAAAREAVLKWRFVPAKRGSDAIESWVGVPIVFSLEQ